MTAVSATSPIRRILPMLMLLANLWTVAQPAKADGHSGAAEAHIEAMIRSAKSLLATDYGDPATRTEQVLKG